MKSWLRTFALTGILATIPACSAGDLDPAMDALNFGKCVLTCIRDYGTDSPYNNGNGNEQEVSVESSLQYLQTHQTELQEYLTEHPDALDAFGL